MNAKRWLTALLQEQESFSIKKNIKHLQKNPDMLVSISYNQSIVYLANMAQWDSQRSTANKYLILIILIAAISRLHQSKMKFYIEK